MPDINAAILHDKAVETQESTYLVDRSSTELATVDTFLTLAAEAAEDPSNLATARQAISHYNTTQLTALMNTWTSSSNSTTRWVGSQIVEVYERLFDL